MRLEAAGALPGRAVAKGGPGYLKVDCSSLKAALRCFISSACFFFSSCSALISSSKRLDTLMAWTWKGTAVRVRLRLLCLTPQLSAAPAPGQTTLELELPPLELDALVPWEVRHTAATRTLLFLGCAGPRCAPNLLVNPKMFH